MTTTTPEKAPATGSSSAPGSTESGATASLTVVVDDAFWQKMGEKMDEIMGEALKPIVEKLDGVDKRLDGVDKRLDGVDKRLDRVDKRLDGVDKRLDRVDKWTGLLVEEIVRKLAARNFGENFSRSFTIKSIHDLVTLISKADTKSLRYRDWEARFKAVEKVIDFLSPLLPVFLESAVDHVAKAMDEEALFNSEALKDAKQKIRSAQEKLKADTQADKAKLVECCGIVLGSVKELSTVQIDGESKTDQDAREKKMNKRFKRKLERIQKSLKDDGDRGLATCEGAGILMCNALAAAGRAVWEEGGATSPSDWIREQCIFDFKEEIECDLRPSVEIISGIVTLMVGEIKASINDLGAAKCQMIEQIRLLDFGLWCIFGNELETKKIVKGQLFVLEAEADHQRLENTFDEEQCISIFVHKTNFKTTKS